MISLKNNYINKNINNVITYNDINISKIDTSFNYDIIKNKDININKQYKQHQQLKQLTSASIHTSDWVWISITGNRPWLYGYQGNNQNGYQKLMIKQGHPKY